MSRIKERSGPNCPYLDVGILSRRMEMVSQRHILQCLHPLVLRTFSLFPKYTKVSSLRYTELHCSDSILTRTSYSGDYLLTGLWKFFVSSRYSLWYLRLVVSLSTSKGARSDSRNPGRHDYNSGILGPRLVTPLLPKVVSSEYTSINGKKRKVTGRRRRLRVPPPSSV